MPEENTSKRPGKGRIRKIIGYEKIAAGEVVERPASVVKELVENSIDANADRIVINIKNFGKELIQVIDNGCGIHSEDVEVAFQPHTSSKITSAEDLNALSTLGFRGEALYSIASVSRVELITRTADEEIGTRIIIEGGKTKLIERVGTPVGTNIKVRDLFYNTPARRKFLKSDRVELGHITDIVIRLALAYPRIHFTLRHNDIILIDTPSTDKPINVIFDLFGKEKAKKSEYFEKEIPPLKVYGILGHPTLARRTVPSSGIYINGRYVINNRLSNAVKDAYRDYITVNTYPFYQIFIEVDPSIVDFNVHPAKKKVRFADEDPIIRKFYNIIRNTVEELFGTAASDVAREKKDEEVPQSPPERSEIKDEKDTTRKKDIIELRKDGKEEKDGGGYRERTAVDGKTSVFHGEPVSVKRLKKIAKAVKDKGGKGKDLRLDRLVSALTTEDRTGISEEREVSKKKRKIPSLEKFDRDAWIDTGGVFPKLKLINEAGQVGKTYIIFEGEDGIYILDQHAAAERIKYEETLAQYLGNGIKSQVLIAPLKFEADPVRKEFLLDKKEELAAFGFDIDYLGGTTFAVRAVPEVLGTPESPELIIDICNELIKIGRECSLTDKYGEIIKYIACHRSLRGGTELLSPAKSVELLKKLARCKNPYHCAHGRPTIIFINYRSLETLFKRT